LQFYISNHSVALAEFYKLVSFLFTCITLSVIITLSVGTTEYTYLSACFVVDVFCQAEEQSLLREIQHTEMPPVLVTEIKDFITKLEDKVIRCGL